MNDKISIKGGNRSYDELVYLKGIAIIAISIMHLIQGYMSEIPGIVNKAASFGGTGVHIFFFCSGFGLYLSQIKRPLTFVQFIKRRFLKIYVPYVIIITIYAIIPTVRFDGDRLQAWLSHVFLYKMFSPVYETSFGTLWWYMSTTFQFYISFLFLYKLKEKAGNVGYAVICLLMSLIWWIFVGAMGLSEERIYNSFFLQYLWEFGLGMVAADKFSNSNVLEFENTTLLVLCVIGIVTEGITGLLGGVLKLFNDIPAMVGFFSLSLLFMRKKFINQIGIKVGEISFELYLIHCLIYSIIFFYTPGHLVYQLIAGTSAYAISMMAAVKLHKILINFQKLWINKR